MTVFQVQTVRNSFSARLFFLFLCTFRKPLFDLFEATMLRVLKKYRARILAVMAAILISLAVMHSVNISVMEAVLGTDVISIKLTKAVDTKNMQMYHIGTYINTVQKPGDKPKDQSHWSVDDVTEILEQSKPWPDVILHYVWCRGDIFFDFRKYLSIKSGIKVIQPQKVMFHYWRMPMEDPAGYHTWFDKLRREFPNIVLVKINSTQDVYSRSLEFYARVFDILRIYGGLFAPVDSIVFRMPVKVRRMPFATGVMSCTQQTYLPGLVFAEKGQLKAGRTEQEMVKAITSCGNTGGPFHACFFPAVYAQNLRKGSNCVRLVSMLYPRDIWAANDRLATTAKMIAYGRIDLAPRLSKSASDQTPRVAHYLCGENCQVSFTFYLSILSALHVAGMDHVTIHGPSPPYGKWWAKVRTGGRAGRVNFVQRNSNQPEAPGQVSSNEMQRYITRTEIMLQNGGVFLDSHVLWTQALPTKLLEYEAVVSPCWQHHGGWPDSIDHTVFLANKKASYLEQLLKLYRQEADAPDPSYVDRYLSYRMIELDPNSAYINPHLQVQCMENTCHPTWEVKNPSREADTQSGGLQNFDWRHEALSVQFKRSGTAPELDIAHVATGADLISDIAKHILTAAGESLN